MCPELNVKKKKKRGWACRGELFEGFVTHSKVYFVEYSQSTPIFVVGLFVFLHCLDNSRSRNVAKQ